MAVRLVFLGKLADVAGGADRTVAAISLAEVLDQLDPALALAVSDERVRIALNGELLARDTIPALKDGDEVAFLPPVSGG